MAVREGACINRLGNSLQKGLMNVIKMLTERLKVTQPAASCSQSFSHEAATIHESTELHSGEATK